MNHLIINKNTSSAQEKVTLEQPVEIGNNTSDLNDLQKDPQELAGRVFEGFAVDDKKATMEGLSKSFDIKRHDNNSKEIVKSTAHNKSYIEASKD